MDTPKKKTTTTNFNLTCNMPQNNNISDISECQLIRQLKNTFNSRIISETHNLNLLMWSHIADKT